MALAAVKHSVNSRGQSGPNDLEEVVSIEVPESMPLQSKYFAPKVPR